ncbi:hypothetical protein PanWU01x14_314200 [Parasponia andersonii]|uniref:Uncharacterized protein n=1 Tax=Parasponia andersonii TaxID=3476 RepID=A0A2P5AP13_PARAD|nr:hypothetical protein PanWU01x14_314200 [Parasponia andersonii]
MAESFEKKWIESEWKRRIGRKKPFCDLRMVPRGLARRLKAQRFPALETAYFIWTVMTQIPLMLEKLSDLMPRWRRL